VKVFRNVDVKLVINGYAVHGVITNIKEDSIFFKSNKGIVSAISLDAIDSIVPSKRGGI